MSNYISHKLIEPPYYQRQFEHDLPEASSGWGETAQRAGLLALPFLSLHQPFGFGISALMGGCRSVTHLYEAGVAGYSGEVVGCLSQVGLLALSVAALAGTFFNFQIGLLATTLFDTALNLVHTFEYLWIGEYAASLEQLLQLLSSILYISIMLTGSLEVALASLLVQALISCYQARTEWMQGRWPEFAAKLAMGAVRCYQAHQQLQLIHRRNFFLSFEKFARLMQQVQKGRETEHLIGSPMHELSDEVVLVDAQGKRINFGAHFHGSGKGTVKGMNLEFRTQVIDGKTMTELDFKVNHVFRTRLQGVITELQSFSQSELKEFLALSHSHAKGISIKNVPMELSHQTGKTMGQAWKISFEGLGTVQIGGSTDYPNLYDRVKVVIDEDKSLYELHEMLSFFSLTDALRLSAPDDIERLKIGQLFRIFHPDKATYLEREERFFTLPVDELKAMMIKMVPSMSQTFSSYLAKMEVHEILPGRMRYCIPGLAEEIYKLGGRSLITTVTGSWGTETFDRVASMLKMGMLSSETRYTHDMMVGGMSPSADFYTGGADSVFTQFLTEKNFREQMSLNELYWGNVRLLLSLDLIETGTYQYHGDEFGTRRIDWSFSDYLHRPNIFDYTRQQQTYGFPTGSELMVKERIPPEMIKGLIVPDVNTRNNLVERLRLGGVITRNQAGVEMIFNKPIEQFIHIGNSLNEKMLISAQLS